MTSITAKKTVVTTALLVFSTIMNHPIRKFVVIALIGEVNRKLLANACNAIAKPLDNSAGAEPLLHEVTNFEPEVLTCPQDRYQFLS